MTVPVLTRIPVARVVASPDQNREEFDPVALGELAASIGELGLLQPIVVRREDGLLGGERYVLVAGERRLRACRDVLGHEDIAAIVTDEPLDELAAFRTLAENMIRANPGPLEEAKGLAQVASKFGLEPCELAAKVGKSPKWVADRLSLLLLADDVAHWVQAGTFPIGRAVLIAKLDVNRQRLAVQAHERGLGPDAFRALAARLADEQSADAMFDPDAFLVVDEYVAEALQAVVKPPTTVREEMVGMTEIAQLLEVKPATVAQWRQRGIFPDPDRILSGAPLWWESTVLEFAERTGRI
jgi:ParB/RepB/Spo0J family partition protein